MASPDNNDFETGTLSEIARESLRRNLTPKSLTGHFAKGAFVDYVMMAPFGSQPNIPIFLSASACSLILDTSLPVARHIGFVMFKTGFGIMAHLFDGPSETARPDQIRAFVEQSDQEWLRVWRSLSDSERQHRINEHRRQKATNDMIVKSLQSGRGPGLLLI